MIIRRASLLIVILVLISSLSWAWEGKCVAVTDGDTIKVMHEGKAERIRLYGIDCPERKQAYGQKAKKFTSDMVFGKTVEVLQVDTDRYGRTIAWVYIGGKGGRNLNQDLVGVGLAWHYVRYALDNPELKRLQADARENKRGLWKNPRSIPPWEYRKGEKSKR